MILEQVIERAFESVADGDGIFDVEGGLGIVQYVRQHRRNQKFAAGHFAGEAKARQAFFDPGFEFGEAIEFAGVAGEVEGAALEGDTEVGEDVLGAKLSLK